MRRSILDIRALGLACALAGCDATDATAVAPRDNLMNGVAVNSAQINGWHLNGWHLNGDALAGWRLADWRLGGAPLHDVALDGTLLRGEQTIAGVDHVRSGLDFVGSELSLVRDDLVYTLRIDAITPVVAGSDVYVYSVAVKGPGDAAWQSLCRDATGAATGAIPLKNYWDLESGDRVDAPEAITLACRGAALAKCVEWGYRPWATVQTCDAKGKHCQEVALADHHQACTRMVRADYCGDGTPHTLDGTPIDVYDALDPHVQKRTTTGKRWKPEAEWGPDGAICVGEALRLAMFEGAEPPPCLEALADADDCGELPPDRDGALANAYCPDWLDDPDGCGDGDDKPNKPK